MDRHGQVWGGRRTAIAGSFLLPGRGDAANATYREAFLASESVCDVVIGMADGLTVPFALAAGLSGAGSSTAIIVTAGLAEVAADAIAVGLGATSPAARTRSIIAPNGGERWLRPSKYPNSSGRKSGRFC
jgi:hypothetical protein